MLSDAGFIIVLLALFGIKHFFCDFVFQTSDMVREKGTYGADGGLNHAMTHVIGTLLVLMWWFDQETVRWVVVYMAVVDGIIHYHVDWAKQQLSRGLTPADRKFWVWFGADQALHYLTYVFLIGWALTLR